MNRVALFGFPLGHSLSPAMHNAAFRASGLTDWVYEACPTSPDALSAAVRGFFQTGGVGASVTIPHKLAVGKCVDELTVTARLIGAENTIYMRESKLIGHNTDGLGFLNALRDAGVNPRGMNVVLLGAGGAARAVAFAIAPQVRSLTILNRHVTRAEQLAQDVRSSFQGLALDVARIDALARAQLIVNATSAGMAPRMDESPLPDDAPIPPGAVVYDLIYSPRETKLLKMARASGAVTLNGLGMLVHQGAEAFQLWTGLKAPLEIMRRAVEENETVAEKDG